MSAHHLGPQKSGWGRLSTQTAPQPENAAAKHAETLDLLRQYKELLDQGVLTQEEFDVKKKELLGL